MSISNLVHARVGESDFGADYIIGFDLPNGTSPESVDLVVKNNVTNSTIKSVNSLSVGQYSSPSGTYFPNGIMFDLAYSSTINNTVDLMVELVAHFGTDTYTAPAYVIYGSNTSTRVTITFAAPINDNITATFPEPITDIIPYSNVSLYGRPVWDVSAEGRIFYGWQKSDGGVLSMGDTSENLVLSNVSTNITLRAFWGRTTFGVTYDPNAPVEELSGSVPVDTGEYTGNQYIVTQAGTIARGGYTLNGWSVGDANLYRITGDMVYFNNDNIVLYAVWGQNIVFDTPTVANTSGSLDALLTFNRPRLESTNEYLDASIPITYSVAFRSYSGGGGDGMMGGGGPLVLVGTTTEDTFATVVPVGTYQFTVSASTTDPSIASNISVTTDPFVFTSAIASNTTKTALAASLGGAVAAGQTVGGVLAAAMASPAVTNGGTATPVASAVEVMKLASDGQLLESKTAVISAISAIKNTTNSTPTTVAAVVSLPTTANTVDALKDVYGGQTVDVPAETMTTAITTATTNNTKTATPAFLAAIAAAPTAVVIPTAEKTIQWTATSSTINIYFPTSYDVSYNVTMTNATVSPSVIQSFTIFQNSATKSLTINGSSTYSLGDTFTVAGLTLTYGLSGSAGFFQGPPPNAVCFLGSAPVLTPAGYRRIDSLAMGDLVRTADGRDVAIVRVKHQRIGVPSAAVNPYVIPKGVWGATENLAISPRHCVAVPGRGMVEARELGLRQLEMRAAFDYYNLELPEWDNMVVAGVEVESLAPRKRIVMTVAELAKLAVGVPVEKLAKLVTVLADGRVAVQMTRKERRMRA